MMRSPLKSQAGFASRDEVARSITLQAPVGGLNTRDTIAAMKPIYAVEMRNFWPERSTVSLRKGYVNHVTALPAPAKTLASWSGADGSKMFAFTDNGIFDVTDPGVAGASVQSCTNGNACTVNFSTAGNTYLITVNGADSYRYRNSSGWTSFATLTVDGSPAETLDTKDLIYVAVHQKALYFLKKNSTDFYFFPVGSVSGNIKKFPLGSLFNQGGVMVGIGTWTVDGGEGKDDYVVFLTSEGQAAVYAGTDPATAANWTLKGIYDIGRPLGRLPFLKQGGDLLILTENGIVSLTKVLTQDGLTSDAMMTAIIAQRYLELANGLQTDPSWQILSDQSRNLFIINVPKGGRPEATQLAMNMATGAWTEFTEWDTRCWVRYKGQLYAGIGNEICHMWVNADDRGKRIPASVRCAWAYLSPRSRVKQVTLFRFSIELQGSLTLLAGADVDYQRGEAYSQIAQLNDILPVWNSAVWDTDVWGASAGMHLDWVDLGPAEGYAVSPRLQVYAGNSLLRWTATDLIYSIGGLK